jgi:hypothetical protein
MPSDAVESFTYAFDRDLLALYGAAVLGWWLMDQRMVLPIPIPVAREFVGTLVSLPFYLAGLALFVGGVVGVLHRVVTDVA